VTKRPATIDVTDLPSSIRIIQRANRTLGTIAPATVARLNQRLFVRPRRFDAREWELAFEAMGTRSRLSSGVSILRAGLGPPVACIHGWEGRATQFAHFAPALVAAGFSVLAIDGPAHGHSRGDSADPFVFADALLDVQREIGTLHGLIGHSMGAGSILIALSLGLQAARVVTIAVPSSLHDVLHRFAAAMHMPPRATEHFIGAMRRRFAARADGVADMTELAASLNVPALLVHSRDDREVPFEDSERLAEHWAGAQLLEVVGLGHRRILRDPAVIEQTVAFMTSGTD
jgi:pimeloyl-ACP methyl ester carboxylesterase